MVRIQRLLWIGLAALSIQVAISLKHYASHYLVPALVFVSLLAAAVYLMLRENAWNPVVRWTLTGIFAVLVGGAVVQSAREVSKRIGFDTEYVARMRNLSELRLRQTGCITLGFYRSSAPGFALSFGNNFSNRESAPELMRLYPDLLVFDRFKGTFESFDAIDATSRVAAMVSGGQCVLIQGSTLAQMPMTLPRGFRLESLAEIGNEGLYRLRFE